MVNPRHGYNPILLSCLRYLPHGCGGLRFPRPVGESLHWGGCSCSGEDLVTSRWSNTRTISNLNSKESEILDRVSSGSSTYDYHHAAHYGHQPARRGGASVLRVRKANILGHPEGSCKGARVTVRFDNVSSQVRTLAGGNKRQEKRPDAPGTRRTSYSVPHCHRG